MLAPLLVSFLPSALDTILDDPKLQGAIVSAYVATADGRPIYQRNATLHMVPASNQKLLSNAFAMHVLGADYRPATRFWKLPGRVFVDSPGDPMITYAQLQDVKSKLRVDPSTLVVLRQAYAPGVPDTWEYDDLPNKYAAKVTAFTVDRGSFELWFRAGRLTLSPHHYGVEVHHVPGSGTPRVSYDPFSRRVTVEGKLPATDTRLDTLALPQPDRDAAFLIGSALTPARENPPSLTPDLVLTGAPLSEMIAACLQPSDNNIAEHLMLMSAARGGALPASPYGTARQRMRAFLTDIAGIDPADVRPYDGSGMSRHNYVTTRAIAKLLQWANSQPTAPLWRQALAAPGKGTLARRLEGVTFQGKTGTLNMVVALSGYVKHKSGQDLVASVIFNQYGCTASEARELADAFVKQVAATDLPAREGGDGKD